MFLLVDLQVAQEMEVLMEEDEHEHCGVQSLRVSETTGGSVYYGNET